MVWFINLSLTMAMIWSLCYMNCLWHNNSGNIVTYILYFPLGNDFPITKVQFLCQQNLVSSNKSLQISEYDWQLFNLPPFSILANPTHKIRLPFQRQQICHPNHKSALILTISPVKCLGKTKKKDHEFGEGHQSCSLARKSIMKGMTTRFFDTKTFFFA